MTTADKENIKVSIVVPAFNRELQISNAIESILQQTHQNFEIIVVDDCSTDKTVDIVKSYLKDPRVILIENEKNMERAFSRNRGIEKASGDILTFLDSDDKLSPSCFEDAARCFAKYGHDFFFNETIAIDDNGKEIYRYTYPKNNDHIAAKRSITEGNFLSCIGVFLSREIYQNYRFDDSNDLSGTEDWDLWLRILAKHPIHRIEKVNSFLIEHADRSMNDSNFGKSIYRKKKIVIEKIHADPFLNETYKMWFGRLESCALLYCARLLAISGDKTTSALYLIRAFFYWPRCFFTKRYLWVLLRILNPT